MAEPRASRLTQSALPPSERNWRRRAFTTTRCTESLQRSASQSGRTWDSSLEFCTLHSRFRPFYKGFEDFSGTCIQSGVAENLLVPGSLPESAENVLEGNRGFLFVPEAR